MRENVDVFRERKKNLRVVSSYLQLSSENRHREKVLYTFTSSYDDPFERLAHIHEIKNYVAALINNTVANIAYFAVIEVGKSLKNAHCHINLFFDAEDLPRIEKIFHKTVSYFNLNEDLCVLTREKKSRESKKFTYILKEFSKQLTDAEVIAIASARDYLRSGSNENIQFYSRSRSMLAKPVYKKFFFEYGLEYEKVDSLYLQMSFRVEKIGPSSRDFVLHWSLEWLREQFTERSLFIMFTQFIFFVFLQSAKIPEKFLCITSSKVNYTIQHCNKHVEYG